LPALSSSGETLGTGQACSLRVARLFGRGFDSPRLQNFAKRNFVLSEPAFGASRRASGLLICFCYILECVDHSYYVGVSYNPADREREHNAGKGSDWTAARRPVRLAWTEEHLTLSSARKRENQLKGWSRAKKAALVRGSPRLCSGQGL